MSDSVKAVATAAALVGEMVVDSPSSKKPIVQTTSVSNRGINRHDLSSQQIKAMLERYDDSSSSWMERGFSWWARQRDMARQEFLRREVEEQRRKLVESEAIELHHLQESVGLPHSLLPENDVFRQHTHHSDLDEQNHLLRVSTPEQSKSGRGLTVQLSIEDDEEMWIPEAQVEPETDNNNPFVLSQPQRQSLASLALPPGLMYCRWIRLYSLARDGDSFFTFLNKVKGSPHTVLVVRTTKGAVFGGYADSPWQAQHQVSPEFFGSAQACLFRISGDEAKVYKWTGVNRYVQFVDSSTKMIAFGGGGGSFGLCVEQDFQTGSTDNCATFDNEPLCDEQCFDIVDVECYGFLTGVF